MKLPPVEVHAEEVQGKDKMLISPKVNDSPEQNERVRFRYSYFSPAEKLSQDTLLNSKIMFFRGEAVFKRHPCHFKLRVKLCVARDEHEKTMTNTKAHVVDMQHKLIHWSSHR